MNVLFKWLALDRVSSDSDLSKLNFLKWEAVKLSWGNFPMRFLMFFANANCPLRAWWALLILACSSIFFHSVLCSSVISKGDCEEVSSPDVDILK